MADLGPLVEEWILGNLAASIYVPIDVDPLVEEWTFGAMTIALGSAVLLNTPIQEVWSFGRLGFVITDQLTVPPVKQEEYNGTTYELLMTGQHVGLPALVLDCRSIQAQEGGVRTVEPIVQNTPGGNPATPLMVGLATSDDLGADPPTIGDTTQTAGRPFYAVTFQEGVAGVLMGAAYDQTLSEFATVLTTTSATLKPFTEIGRLLGKPRHLGHATSIGFYAATSFGFFVYNDSVDPPQWINRNMGLSGPSISGVGALPGGSLIVVACDPAAARVIVGEDSLIHKSTDGGLHWSGARGDFPDDVTIRDLYVASTTHWYAATDAGVYKTTDGGVHWLLANGDLVAEGGNVDCFSVTGDLSNRNVCVVGGKSFVARTTNNGATWAVKTSADGLGSAPVRFRVFQAESKILAAYGEFYAGQTGNFIWRSDDDGVTWTVAFPNAQTSHVNAFAYPTGYSSDLVAIATPKLQPEVASEPWTPTPIGERTVLRRSSLVDAALNVDAATLAAIVARAELPEDENAPRARLIVRQIKDYKTQKVYQRIASAEYESVKIQRSSLAGLADVQLTGRDVNVKAALLSRPTVRVLTADEVLDARMEEGGLVLSMLVDETILPYSRISWQSVEYEVTGISYELSETGRLMALSTKTRVLASPVAVDADTAAPADPLPTRSTAIAVFHPPRVGALARFGR